MRIRIGLSANFSGTTEVDVPDEEVERRGGLGRYVDRGAEDWAQRVYEQVVEVEVEIEDLDVFNEETDQWEAATNW